MTSRASVELIDATLRSVHHALASSIQSVRNRVFLAERRLAGDDAQEQLRTIERHVARAEHVMRRLLVLTPALAPPRLSSSRAAIRSRSTPRRSRAPSRSSCATQ
ncbi:MAG: hypothetical protein K8H88_03245 [Sandaracinaceae bacterium]|nr:hypothetical protein [Sandaracinaceae bacterium]